MLFGRHRRTGKNNIKMDAEEIMVKCLGISAVMEVQTDCKWRTTQ
jgi:hypothetical protein